VDGTRRALQQVNLVAYPDRAILDHPRADTTATLWGLRHTRFGKPLDVPADRARPPVLERNLPDAESLATSQGPPRENTWPNA
jgi:hypothetical protein